MKYRATLGLNAILITVSVSLLLGSLATFFAYRAIVTPYIVESIVDAAVVLLLLFLYSATYLYHPRSYLLEKGNLVISRPISDIRISLHDVKSAFTVDRRSMEWPERVGGNGGVFGFYGQFRNHFGLMTWYATKNSNFVMIEKADNSRIVITPDNTSIVKDIRKLIAGYSNTDIG